MYGAPDDASITADTLADLLAAMREARVFRGDVLATGSGEAGKTLACQVRLRMTRISRPKIVAGVPATLLRYRKEPERTA